MLDKLNLVSLGFCFSKREIILVSALGNIMKLTSIKHVKHFSQCLALEELSINDVIITCLSGYLTPSEKMAKGPR